MLAFEKVPTASFKIIPLLLMEFIHPRMYLHQYNCSDFQFLKTLTSLHRQYLLQDIKQ